MVIEFDDAAADGIAQAARNAATELRAQSATRRSAAENVAKDFSGHYANLLKTACLIESEDRINLAGILESLVTQVEAAKTRATEEKQRAADLSAWQDREDARDRKRAMDALSPGAPNPVAEPYDPKPSDTPLSPPSVSAAFSARERNRAASILGGSSSANPNRLRSFVTSSNGLNTSLENQLTSVKSAWTRFTSSCGWVNFGSATFLAGFEKLLAENRADALLVEKVAAAFELAGGDQSLLSPNQLQSTLTDATIGTSVELMVRYRTGLIVPGENAERLAKLFEAQDKFWPKELVKGKIYSVSPSGLLIPEGSLPAPPVPPGKLDHPKGWSTQKWLTPSSTIGTPPQWAKWGGRGLGVAGTGITLWSTYSSSYNSTLTKYPTWDESQRQQRALEDTAFVGGHSALGAAGGAWAGASIGAAIGSIFPGPGTLIGGIIGGVIGGIAGGMAGNNAAQATADYVRGEN
ncbi:hypothetical protein [Leucobacter viscericola]|uniref:hypothetical protein n=1 Tax=Leucobacter viscericola TaxID=2714935 RepID=UPI0019808849|nr:hypothetical protein [Leucobacter viscericola]